MESSLSEGSSLEVPAVPYAEDIQFPFKEPLTEKDYLEFFSSLFTVNLCEAEQQIIKAFCSVLEKAPPEARESICKDDRIEAFLYCCIARADVGISDLLAIYAPCGSQTFASLIPVLIWVFVSQKSKRFVEPLLVKNYEGLLSQYQAYLKKFAFVSELSRLVHQPISNSEKQTVILLYFCVFLYNIENVSESAVKCYLALIRDLVNGVEYPNPDIRLVEERLNACKYALQQQLSKDTIVIILNTIATISPQYQSRRKKAVRDILKYSQKETIPECVFLAMYLYRSYG